MRRYCPFVLVEGTVGATMDDDVDPVVCRKPATWKIYRSDEPSVRPRYRCDEHVGQYRALNSEFGGMVIEPA